MNKKIFKNISLLILPVLLSSCGGGSLRKDISEFIKDFSYENARKNVLKGHYLDKGEGTYLGKPCLFLDEVYFDVSKEKVVSFYHHYKTVNYGSGIADEEYTHEVKTVDNKYYYVDNGKENEVSYDAAYQYTNRFFFATYYEQTGHHYGAMYYGDMIKSEAYKQQSFVTIDQEKQTYTYNIDGYKEQTGIVIAMNYVVNKLGMLLSLTNSGYSEVDPTTKVNETITVTY